MTHPSSSGHSDRQFTPLPTASVKDGDLATAMDFTDFMSQVGVVMRLPTRDTKAIPVVPAVAKRGRAMKVGWLPVVATCCVVAFIGIRVWPEARGEMPSDILGAWETTDPRYAGRRLVLDPLSITSVADSSSDTQWVERVDVSRRGDTLAVVVSYGEPGARQELALAHLARPVEHITMQHPAGVTWTRAGTAQMVPAAAK